MKYEQICRAVERVNRKYQESDPFRLCKDMGIILCYVPLGNEPTAIKGFYLERNRIRTITVNSDLPIAVQRIIVAHELGHAVLHKNCGVSAFHEAAMFDESSVYEKDANIFAAEYLMRDEDVLAHLNADSTFFSAAAALHVPMELLDFKFRVMKWRGYKLMEAPIMSQSNFLKDIEVPYNDDNHIC